MRKLMGALVLAVLLVALLCSTVLAQGGGYARVSGATTWRGKPALGVPVYFCPASGGGCAVLYSNQSGIYDGYVPAGNYTYVRANFAFPAEPFYWYNNMRFSAGSWSTMDFAYRH